MVVGAIDFARVALGVGRFAGAAEETAAGPAGGVRKTPDISQHARHTRWDADIATFSKASQNAQELTPIPTKRKYNKATVLKNRPSYSPNCSIR